MKCCVHGNPFTVEKISSRAGSNSGSLDHKASA